MEGAKSLWLEAIDNLELNETPEGIDLFCKIHCNVALININAKNYKDALYHCNESL